MRHMSIVQVSKVETMCTSFLEQGEQGYAWSRYLQVKGGILNLCD